MKRLLLLGVAAVALATSGPAMAAQTFSGGTGLIDVPTAATLAPRGVEVAADFVNTDDASVPVRAEIGVYEGLEVGALFQYNDGDQADNKLGLNAKYRLPLVFVENLGVAVGGSYANMDPVDFINVFVVATYDLKLEGFTVAATGGLDWLRVSNGDSDSALGLMLGVELGIEAVPGLSVVAEYDGDNGDVADDSAGIAARYAVNENITVQAGFKDFDGAEMFFGVQYAVGL